MMKDHPVLRINLAKITQNARTITSLCRQHGIKVAGVTKGVGGMPEVAEAMLQGGCTMLADSRLENLRRLRTRNFPVEYLLLRLPMISEVEEVVRVADISLNSEIETLQALNVAAREAGIIHKILVMIDVGDLREGLWPDKLPETIEALRLCEHLRLEGIGCNLACYGGVIPTPENMQILLDQKRLIETRYQQSVALVSGGNSSGLGLLASGEMPDGINHFRVGETILLGRNSIDRSPFPGTVQDTCVIRAEIIECKEKPSVPIGPRGQDAFGQIPVFQDRGIRRRAILGLGRQDVPIEGLRALDSRVEILGGSSDHLLVDVTEAEAVYGVGDAMEFSLNYACLLAASTSEYFRKECV